MMQLFYYYDQNPSGFAFLCKLELLLFKPHWGYQIWIWKKTEKNSGRRSKMTPSCKWPIEANIRDCAIIIRRGGGGLKPEGGGLKLK